MSTSETFGPDLRRARLSRGLSLDEIARQTNINADLLEEMERNDFSRWPSGIYARAWIRSYAALVGLDTAETLNDFCRFIPNGDRRAAPLVRRVAEISGHDLSWHDDVLHIAGGDRRASTPRLPDRVRQLRARYVRLIAAAIDLAAVTMLATIASAFLPVHLWTALGLIAPVYHATGISLIGCAPAVWLIDTYATAHPQFRRRGELFAFRRLQSNDRRSSQSLP